MGKQPITWNGHSAKFVCREVVGKKGEICGKQIATCATAYPQWKNCAEAQGWWITQRSNWALCPTHAANYGEVAKAYCKFCESGQREESTSASSSQQPTSLPHGTPSGLDDAEEEFEEEDFKSVLKTMMENVECRFVVVAARLEEVEKKLHACGEVAARLEKLEAKIDFLNGQIASLWPKAEQ